MPRSLLPSTQILYPQIFTASPSLLPLVNPRHHDKIDNTSTLPQVHRKTQTQWYEQPTVSTTFRFVYPHLRILYRHTDVSFFFSFQAIKHNNQIPNNRSSIPPILFPGPEPVSFLEKKLQN